MASQGGASASKADLDRGRRIGKFEIVTRLSVGGMAELFLAFTSGRGGFRKFVALKQILPDVQKDEEFVRMFLEEARITAAFSHANIGQVFELGEEEDELYLAMEFLPGQNLEQLLETAHARKRLLPVGFSARAIRDACLGLHYAHAFTSPTGKPTPVIHRDVSLRNVMVTYDGHVKVIDFGIAKMKGKIGRTRVGMVKGTTGYMSPEQVHGYELDGRSDLFCAGILLHELLTGRRLFDGTNEVKVMLAIAEGPIDPPSSLNSRVPEALSDVVMRALARDPAERFATGREMARAIETACGQELYHEEQMASVMRQLFEDKILKTRALMEGTDEGGNVETEPTRQVRTPEPPAARSQRAPAPAPRPAPRKHDSLPPARVAPPPRAQPPPSSSEQETRVVRADEIEPPAEKTMLFRPEMLEPEAGRWNDQHTVRTAVPTTDPDLRAQDSDVMPTSPMMPAPQVSEPAREPAPAARGMPGWVVVLLVLVLLAAVGGGLFAYFQGMLPWPPPEAVSPTAPSGRP
jgi:serine/threonine-protein kinase